MINNPKTELLWTSVPINEVLERGSRFEASVFDIEGKHARKIVDNCIWDVINLWSKDGIIENAQYPGRFKRIYVSKSNGHEFFMPSQLNELKPRASKFISQKTDMDLSLIRANKNEIFLTRSGTIGNVTIVSKTLKGKLFSDDVIRITTKNKFDIGYLYTFLKSDVGKKIVQTNNYGAVIKHIEPEHLKNISIPNPPKSIKKSINKLIVKSFRYRDESNDLIDKAHRLLIDELGLPPIEQLNQKYFNSSTGIRSFDKNMKNLDNRLDGSYHLPIIDSILEYLKKTSLEITTIGDDRLSEKVTLPGRFKRVFVEDGQGAVFFGGKQLLELDPQGKKYLSPSLHQNRINQELKIKENTVLISRSGTIGKVMIAPKHWDNWIVNEHVIRIFPKDINFPGYIYAWLTTDYGNELIKRFTYGAVVDEIDDNHVSSIQIPMLKNIKVQNRINNMVLKANKKRYEAYIKENQAIRILEQEVFTSKKT